MSTPASDSASAETIVLIHGMWMTPLSWEHWVSHYTDRGHRVLAPAWPGLDKEPEELRRDPSPLRGIDITEVVDHYDKIIRGLDRPPIIIGHSFGGLFAQLLLDRGLGAAGVGIASATVKGVLDLPLSTIRATSPVLRNPFGDHKAVPLNEKQFHYAFANTLSQQESDELYRRYHVPAASTVLREGAFANFRRDPPTKVHFERRRAPLLFIAFGEDHIIPPKASRHNMEKYAGSDAIVAFKEYPGRPHFPGVAGWEEVADFALAWALDPSPLDARETAPA
jgi:pimeloyl-ACP methyl ester carboxylesterase